MEGWEPIITISGTHKYGTYRNIYGVFFPFRRLKWKIDIYKTKRKLLNMSIVPIRCQGCGEGWAEWTIEDANEPRGTTKMLKVCKGCVTFYDIKWTHKRLYNELIDFRG
jgi:hypothetical protein